VEFRCASGGQVSFTGGSLRQVIYRDDLTKPVSSSTEIPTEVQTFDDAQCSTALDNLQTDANGEFSPSVGAESLRISRDVPASSVVDGTVINNQVPPLDRYTNNINGEDCYQTALVTTTQNETPTPYELLSMDVNRDGYVTAGDITLIQERILAEVTEFPQEDNGGVDWVFIDKATKTGYEASDYTRFNVPPVNDCYPLNASAAICYHEQYHGVLLGDADGNWTPADHSQFKSGNKTKFVFDLNRARKTVHGEILLPVYTQHVEQITSLDFFMLNYNHNNMAIKDIQAASDEAMYLNFAWNNGLRFTSYATQMDGVTGKAELFNLVVDSYNGQISEEELGDIRAYVNGKMVTTEVLGQLKVTALTGMSSNEVHVNVFPVPNSGQFTVALSKAMDQVTVELLDISGKTVQVIHDAANNKQIQVDASGLDVGVYFVKLHLNNQPAAMKRVVIK